MEWKYLRKISFQGFGTIFYNIIFIMQWHYHLSQQFTQDLMNCHGLMPIYGIMYVWIGNIFEIMIFQGFGTK